jgi:glycosyltransferase involved in cell wall biosynthesis
MPPAGGGRGLGPGACWGVGSERVGEQLTDLLVVSDAREHAGAETYLIALTAGLTGRMRVSALLSRDADRETSRRLADTGVAVSHSASLVRRPSVRDVMQIRRELRTLAPAAVLINLTDQGDALAALAALAVERLPTVGVAHLWVPGRSRRRDRISGLALRRMHTLVAPSAATARRYASLGLRTAVVPHGLEIPSALERAVARRALGVPERALVVGGVGRLTRQKGWDVLVVALRALRDGGQDVHGVIVGDGPLRAELAAAGGDVVSLPGYLPDAARYLAALDVVAVPSRFESFGMVAAEAALAGVPVVASSAEGLAETLGSGSYTVPIGDATALADCLRWVLADLPAARDRAGRAAVEAAERYRPEVMVDRMIAVIDAAHRGAPA